MNGPVLTLLAAVVAALLATGVAAALWPVQGRVLCGRAAAGSAALAVLLAVVVLLLPDAPTRLALPLGLPDQPFALGLDPLAAPFLLLVALPVSLTLAFAEHGGATARSDAGLPVAAAGLLLAVLAADGATLASGIAVAGAGLWLADETRSGAPASCGLPALALAAAVGLLLAFATRDPVAGGPVAAFEIVAGVAGAAALIALAPLQAAQPRRNPLAAAVLSGPMPALGILWLLRILLGLHPGTTVAPVVALLLLAGVAALLCGGLRAIRAIELQEAVGCGMMVQAGAALIGLAFVVIGRALDLPSLAGLAVAAVVLVAVSLSIGATLAMLSCAAIARQAATRRLDRLGGLVHAMPVTTAGLLTGLAAQAGLPLCPGFAALYLLFQAILAAPRGDSFGLPLLLLMLGAVLALGSGLNMIAVIRLVGVVCLGRPRAPRSAGARELPRPAQLALWALIGLSAVPGLLPGPVLQLFGSTDTGLAASRFGWLALAAAGGSRGYAPLPLAALLAASGAAIWWGLRRRTPQVSRSAPLWQGGFAAAPPWFPFGDPLTQWNGAMPFVLPSVPRLRLPPARLRWAPPAPSLALAAFAGLLALIGWAGLW